MTRIRRLISRLRRRLDWRRRISFSGELCQMKPLRSRLFAALPGGASVTILSLILEVLLP